MTGAVLAIAVAAAPGPFVWSAAPAREGRPTASRPARSARLAAEGTRLYARHCASCHGDTGRGDGSVAAGLGVAARDLSAGIYKIRSTPTGSLPTDLDLFQTLSRGLHGTAMFPWTRLGERERWALVGHLRALSPRFQSERPAPPVPVPPQPTATPRLLRRGQELYRLLQCHACHGDTGGADGPAVALYQADPERRVQIRHLDRQLFLRGDEPRDIFLTLRTGLDGTPMGAYDGVPASDLWAVALYVSEHLRQPPPPEPPPRAESPR